MHQLHNQLNVELEEARAQHLLELEQGQTQHLDEMMGLQVIPDTRSGQLEEAGAKLESSARG